MTKGKKFLLGCGFLIGLGITLSFVGFSLGGQVYSMGLTHNGFWVATPSSYGYNNPPEYESNTVTLDSFQNMDLNINYSDLSIVESDHFEIEYRFDKAVFSLDYAVENNTLTITENYIGKEDAFNNSFNWFSLGFIDHSSYNRESPYIIIYIPSDAALETATISNAYGNSEIEDITAKSFIINNEYGELDMMNINASDVSIDIDAGDLIMNNCALDTLSIDNEYGEVDLGRIQVSGDIKFNIDSGSLYLNEVTAGSIYAENEYGDISGDSVTAASMKYILDSGSCYLRKSNSDIYDIYSEYGSVTIDSDSLSAEYGYHLNAECGNVYLNNENYEQTYIQNYNESNTKYVKVICDSEDISIRGNFDSNFEVSEPAEDIESPDTAAENNELNEKSENLPFYKKVFTYDFEGMSAGSVTYDSWHVSGRGYYVIETDLESGSADSIFIEQNSPSRETIYTINDPETEGYYKTDIMDFNEDDSYNYVLGLNNAKEIRGNIAVYFIETP